MASWEVIIRGDTDTVRAYTTGYLRGRGLRRGWVFTGEGFDLSHIRDLVKYHGSVVHVTCTTEARRAIQAAVRDAAEYDFEIVEARRIVRATFPFRFHTASRKVAGSIRRTLGRLPDGARLTAYQPREVVDPSARGAELYTPAHAYEFSGEGRIEGDPFAVRRVWEKLRANEFFDVDDIAIRHAAGADR